MTTFLLIPFRRSYKLSLSDALKNYISAKYDQHPDMFTEDLLIIDRLRHEAVTVQEPHESGIIKLLTYAAQLKWIGAKFPVDVGADFSWFPALGFNSDRPVTQNNLRFELANVLFNLAALYSQLASSLVASSTDNIKAACKSFCKAAGVIAHLRDDILPDMRAVPPDDMDEMTLRSLEHLMLAQAQECIWRRAVIDEMRDASIARLAIMVSDYYAQAGECAVKSNAISPTWIHQMNAKKWHFESAAQFRQSLDCLEKKKYGEEIARLRESLTCVNEALKETRWVSKLIASDLNGLKARVTDDIKRAEKDNDIIYLNSVPPKSALQAIQRVNMVVSKAPTEVTDAMSMIGEDAPLGTPLFSKLVPYAVHIAASIYTDRRDRLVNQTLVGEIESMTSKLREILTSLNLPGSLQALERPLGLPPSLVAHAEEIRQQDGLNRLYESMQDTSRLKASDKATYNEGAALLLAEKEEDDRLRLKYGTERWTREPSEIAGKKNHKSMKDIQGYLDSAQKSDDLVATKLREVDPILRIMQGSNRELEAYVPSSQKASMTPAVQKESARLRYYLNDVSKLEARRKRRIDLLKEKANEDNIHPAILTEVKRLQREFPMQDISPSQFEDLFEERLHRYDSDRDLLEEEAIAQTKIIEELHDANRAFNNARNNGPAGTAVTSERERALQELENGYLRYKEIISNIETGRKFYNDLARLVGKFKEECKKFVQMRRMEAEHLQSDINNASSMASLSISPEPSAPTPAQGFNQSAYHAQPTPTDSFTTSMASAPEITPSNIQPTTQTQTSRNIQAPLQSEAQNYSCQPTMQPSHSSPQQVVPSINPTTIPPQSIPPPSQQQPPSNSSAANLFPASTTAPIFAAPQTPAGKNIPSPVRRAAGLASVTAGTWSPGMPIKFGGPAPSTDNSVATPSATIPPPNFGTGPAGSSVAAGKSDENRTSSDVQKRVWNPDTGLRFA